MTESAEVRLIRQYLLDSGVPHRITSTTWGRHATGSYHYRQGTSGLGLALDVAGPVPGRNRPELPAIYKVLAPLGPHVAELIYSGPGGGFWKHGRQVAPYAVNGHKNHIHIAVPKGTFVHYPKEGSMTLDNVHIIDSKVVAFQPTPSGEGYWMVTEHGQVYAFGDAKWFGGLLLPG